MLKKLSKSRKKNQHPKLANSRNKQPKQHHKDIKQVKQIKKSNKNSHNHHASTLTLLSHHNHSVSHLSHASQSSLLGVDHKGYHLGDKNSIAKKGKSKNRQSSVCSQYNKEVKQKSKSKSKDKQKEKDKQKAKNTKDLKKQKSKKNTSVNTNQNSKSKKSIIRSSPQKQQKQKVDKAQKNSLPLKKFKINKQQLYQRINLGLYNSKTNSQINFSNSSSIRQNKQYLNCQNSAHLPQNRDENSCFNQNYQNKKKKVLTIDCTDEYIINQYFNNSFIKNHQKKRIQASIKIQKVFRGYLTRKMLQQYIQKEQKRLQQLSRKIKNSSSNQLINKEVSDPKIITQQMKMNESRVQKLNKSKNYEEFSDEKIKKLSKHKISNQIFFQNSDQKTTKGLKQDEDKSDNQNFKGRQFVSIQQPDSYQNSQKNSGLKKYHPPINHQALEQQSSIYPQPQDHDSLSQYIPQQVIDKQNKKYLQDSEHQKICILTEEQENLQQNDLKQGSAKLSQFYQRNEQYFTYEQAKKKLQEKQKQKQSIKQYEKKSQQIFKPTPGISYHTSHQRNSKSKTISKIQQPVPTDFSQKKIGEFQYETSNKSKQIYQRYQDKNQNKEKFTLSNQKQSQATQSYDREIKQNKNIRNVQTQVQRIDEHEQYYQRQKKLISNLKKQQKQKWSKIIQMLNHQILQTKSINEDHEKFMNMILQISKKNKEELQKSLENNTNKNINIKIQTNQTDNQKYIQNCQNQQSDERLNEDRKSDRLKNLEIQLSDRNIMNKNAQIERKNNFILFKRPPKNPQPMKQNLQKEYDQEQQQLNQADQQFNQNFPSPKIQYSQILKQQSQKKNYSSLVSKRDKNSDLPLIRKKMTNLNINMYNCHVPVTQDSHHHHNLQPKQNYSILEKTQQLKNFYRKNLPAYPIQQMIQIRQKALQKREIEQLNILNEELVNNKLTHQRFIKRLSEMQDKFQNQRKQINKAKMEIFLGYRATHKLMQDSVKDAWYLGFKIPFSQSMKDFKGNNGSWMWVKHLIVDQLKSYSNQHNNPVQKQNSKLSQKKPNYHLNLNSQLYAPSSSDSNLNSQKKQKLYFKDSKSEKKRQDLSISLPNQNEDSSLTLKQSHDISQQSFYSQQISYNEGEIQLDHLRNDNGTYKSRLDQQQISEEQEQEQLRDQKSPRRKPLNHRQYQSNETVLSNENQSSSELEYQQKNEFTQQLQGFRKIDPKNIVIKNNQKYQVFIQSKNIMVCQEEVYQDRDLDKQMKRKVSINPCRSQKFSRFQQQYITHHNKNKQTNSFVRSQQSLKSQIYNIDGNNQSEDEQQMIFTEKSDPQIIQVTQHQIVQLIWEVTSQLYMNIHMRSKLTKNVKNKAPNKIQVSERISFINLLLIYIPSFEQLLPRINQKMSANRLQLLKFMRVNFDADQESEMDEMQRQVESNDGFQQIGKFQHILPAEICLSAMTTCIQEQQRKQNQLQIYNLSEQVIIQNIRKALHQKVPQQCIKKVIQREKLHKYNQAQKNDLRKQIKKVQYHCIFDSFNELIMKKRLKMSGYSGIGLNQLTLVMTTESFKQIKQQSQFKTILTQSLKQIEDLVSNQKSSNEKLLMENYEKLCQNDSQWILYTDEALSFALQFVYMLQDEIFFQQATLLASIGRKNSYFN